MGQKIPPGLVKRGNIWHICKIIEGHRIRESCGTGDLKEAERYLMHRAETIRNATIYGVRPPRAFRDAAVKYLEEATKASLNRDAALLKILDRFIGDLPLTAVHMGTLQGYIADRRRVGWKKRTINYGLQVVRRILNLAAGEWMDEHGLTWLLQTPRIKLFREDDKKQPYPLSWEEQRKLFDELPEYLAKMALFKVNTGCRDQEVCDLRWEWEVPVPELNTSVFIIPKHKVKNRQDRLVVLNQVASEVVDEMRAVHPTHVFSYKGKPVSRMYNRAWMKARKAAGLPGLRVHDLKHTFGRRLRAAGVSFEDRQDLLGHKSGRITTYYSAPELINLIQAAERVCATQRHKNDTIVILKKKSHLAVVAN
jgi:integrase